jgi:hypothetical protein
MFQTPLLYVVKAGFVGGAHSVAELFNTLNLKCGIFPASYVCHYSTSTRWNIAGNKILMLYPHNSSRCPK